VIRADLSDFDRQHLPTPRLDQLAVSDAQDVFAYRIDQQRIGIYQRPGDSFRLLPHMKDTDPIGNLAFVGGESQRLCWATGAIVDESEIYDPLSELLWPYRGAQIVCYELDTDALRPGPSVLNGGEVWFSHNNRYCGVLSREPTSFSPREELHFFELWPPRLVKVLHFDFRRSLLDEMSNPVALSNDGGLAAIAGDDQAIHVFELDRGTEQATFQGGHRAKISCVGFSPDNKKLASGALDGTIVVWEVSR
jgi:WD40 repeat protein